VSTRATSAAPAARPGAQLVLVVRSALPTVTWFNVLPPADPPQSVGFAAQSGVTCLAFPAGSYLAAVYRAPSEPGAREIATIAIADGAPTTIAGVGIMAAGTVTTGPGIPDWWTDREPCG
jgi:hypothetical protein